MLIFLAALVSEVVGELILLVSLQVVINAFIYDLIYMMFVLNDIHFLSTLDLYGADSCSILLHIIFSL